MNVERPTALFVAAVGPTIGFGHLRRCLTLANGLASTLSVAFLLPNEIPGIELARRAGFPVATGDALERLAAQPIELLIVDDYGCSASRLAQLRSRVGRLAVIDDLADRALDAADAVLNGSPGAEQLPYRTRPDCIRLLGPRYALLDAAFGDLGPRAIPEAVRRVLVTLGGADPHGDTPRVVAAVREALPDALIDVVIGPLFSERSRVTASPSVRVHAPQPQLAGLMSDCDLAVTAGGQTTYELAASGVPAVALLLADNQRHNLQALSAAPTLLALGRDDDAALAAALERLAGDRPLRQAMSAAGQRLFDGRGVARAAAELSRLAQTGESEHG